MRHGLVPALLCLSGSLLLPVAGFVQDAPPPEPGTAVAAPGPAGEPPVAGGAVVEGTPGPGMPGFPASDGPLDSDDVEPEWNVGPVSASARRMLDRVRDSVVQIRGFYGANRAEAFHGTAFAVGDGGLLLTNYHVIARAAQAPRDYRLEYHTDEGQVGTVELLAVDVVHDLALIRADQLAPPVLSLRTSNPAQGDRLYTVGYPLDLGLVITEGIGNGRIANEFSPKLHYAGPMNPGMSGGPALDSRGRVVGINVSFSTRGQLVSFLVPAEFVAPLLERGRVPLPADSIRDEVTRQLRAHQAALLAAVPAPFPVQTAAGYALPAALAPFVNCTAVAGPRPARALLLQSVSCRASVGVSVEPGLVSGDFQFSHDVLVGDGLSPLQFAAQLQRLAARIRVTGSSQHVNPYACKTGTVNLDRFQAAVTLCARSYRSYEGLYDVAMVVVSLNQPRRGFVSSLNLRGVDFDAGMDFSRRYLRAMRWTR